MATKRIQFNFRFKAGDPVDLWLKAQDNKAVSLKYLILEVIAKKGITDIFHQPKNPQISMPDVKAPLSPTYPRAYEPSERSERTVQSTQKHLNEPDRQSGFIPSAQKETAPNEEIERSEEGKTSLHTLFAPPSESKAPNRFFDDIFD